ncbi:MAG TPA: asparagine synthase C-terminal domain-containing protein, partial [Patescibacteria group bacterium]|nr:asparagine synthase C-terminal domain-containing protein [Patescibacteria group bacterium]
LQQYFFLPTTINKNITEKEAIKNIRELIDHSVRIRVQTDLSIAVYLSGGIDSTAILATARKFHNNVTAIILGNEQSTDRNFAVQYCEENTIPYIVQTPPSEEELVKHISEIVHITESFEPNMIRQAAVSYYIAKTAAEAGFKVIFCGEGADELFAGYPEFTTCSTEEEIEQTVLHFLQDLHRTQLQRVDRISMAFTTEVRVPFLDKHLVEYVLQLSGGLKLRKTSNKTITKYILRKAMSDRLPSSIYNRDKVVLSEGAGFKGNQRIGGLFYDIVTKQITDEEFAHSTKKCPQWNLQTKEELYYFREYVKYGYTKATFNQKRTTVNKTDTEKADARLAKTILDTFNTRKYKREQPNTEEKINELILKQIIENKPISFVMYWGKGDRNSISDIENIALQYVNDMLKPIQQIYNPGIQLILVFTDTHAELNGYSTVAIQEYFNSVRTLVAKYNFIEIILMSELVPYEEETLLQVAHKIADTDIPDVFYSSSEKHFQKNNDIQLGAKLYYLQNQLEKNSIEQHFADCIFMTYNSSTWDSIHPARLPIFYMYSLKRGTSIKPWFVYSID